MDSLSEPEQPAFLGKRLSSVGVLDQSSQCLSIATEVFVWTGHSLAGLIDFSKTSYEAWGSSCDGCVVSQGICTTSKVTGAARGGIGRPTDLGLVVFLHKTDRTMGESNNCQLVSEIFPSVFSYLQESEHQD